MIGRDTEIQEIISTYELCIEKSKPHCVLLGGFSGIGKT